MRFTIAASVTVWSPIAVVISDNSVLTGVLSSSVPWREFPDGVLYKIRWNLMYPSWNMAIYLGHMCQCGLHVILWSHIDALMFFFTTYTSSSLLCFAAEHNCGVTKVGDSTLEAGVHKLDRYLFTKMRKS